MMEIALQIDEWGLSFAIRVWRREHEGGRRAVDMAEWR